MTSTPCYVINSAFCVLPGPAQQITVTVYAAYGANIEVPTVTGLTLEEAHKTLAERQLLLVPVAGDPAPTSARAFVIQEQYPVPLYLVDEGAVRARGDHSQPVQQEPDSREQRPLITERHCKGQHTTGHESR